MARDETTFHYAHSDLISDGPTGDLRARLSGRDSGDARPGPGDLYRNAARLLGDNHAVEIAPGVWAKRDALGGISLSTGNLRERMNPESGVAPTASPADSPAAAPTSPLADRIAALTAHMPKPTAAPAVPPEVTPEAAPKLIRNPFEETET